MKQIENINTSVISLAVFDTLLYLPYASHSDLFKHVEIIGNQTGYAQARVLAEQKLLQQKQPVDLDQIYDQMDDKYLNLKKLELQLTRKVVQTNGEILEAL